ncbi:hypothetical protein F2Q70_00018142 [Brassica cretica]|uniref:GH16 domain-containing protein n=1 Tax=Brassica cretica TaxID=69181 RepID=A0A8S9HZU2_BRACR|nr:hypothetical protein F2Q70_00018142 [Brassica cretica]
MEKPTSRQIRPEKRFYVDNVPIREVKRTSSMGGDFPSKPMSLYTTIWDVSRWATNGGKYGVNYKYAPYIARFSDLVLHGCAVDPIEQFPKCDEGAIEYKVSLPECVVNPAEAQRLRVYDPVTFGGIPRRHRRGKHRSKRSRTDGTVSI